VVKALLPLVVADNCSVHSPVLSLYFFILISENYSKKQIQKWGAKNCLVAALSLLADHAQHSHSLGLSHWWTRYTI
jgi:hypothetical protein